MFGDDQVQIALGTVGWDGEADVEFTGAGVTTVKVQLFDGRDLFSKPVPGQGGGRKMECRIAAPFYQACGTPTKGTKVVVAIPAGLAQCSGASIILGRFDDDPSAVALAKAAQTQQIIDALTTFLTGLTTITLVGQASTCKAALTAITDLATTKTKGT